MKHDAAPTAPADAPGLQGRTRPVILPEALQELQATVEELQVAEEELRSQNEALAHAHALLEAERVRYYDLFEFAPDGYLVTDPLGVIREANRAASQLFGLSARFLTGKPFASLVAEDDVRAFRLRLLDVTRTQDRQEWRFRLRHRQKGVFPASLTVAACPGVDAPILRWMVRELSEPQPSEQTAP